MKKIKSTRDHWWPECVSEHWSDAEGKTTFIRPNGETKPVAPKELGVLRNGHSMLFGETSEQTTPWDKSYEGEFANADNWFPEIIKWIHQLDKVDLQDRDLRQRYAPAVTTDKQLVKLTECIVSLAVRSPRNRAMSVLLAEELRGPLDRRERDSLVGLNIHRSQRVVSDAIGYRAKFAILFSAIHNEFIYGDGFFFNFGSGIEPINGVQILAPVTPNISVGIYKAGSFAVEPKLCTLVLNEREVNQCNHAVQTYSRDVLFYKSQKPTLTPAFTRQQHCNYTERDNPIDTLLRGIPGIRQRQNYPRWDGDRVI